MADKPVDAGQRPSPVGPILAVLAGGVVLYALTRPGGQQPPPPPCQPQACPTGKHWVGDPTCACVADTLPPPTGNMTLSWSTAAALPNPRNFTAAAASATHLYCCGGLQDGSPGFAPYCDEYNPATNAWSRLPDMPIGRIAHGVEAVGNYLYVLSGFTDPGFNAQDPSCYRMSLTTKAGWERIPDIPVGRRDFGTAVAGNSIFVIGGNIDEPRSVMKQVHRFDTITGAWAEMAPMNVGRRYPATGGVGGTSPWIASFGGIDNHGTNVIEAFNSAANTWALKAEVTPNSIWSGRAVYIAPYWYLMCGKQSGVTSNVVMQLDSRIQPVVTWVAPGPPGPPNKRADFGAAVLNGKIYLVGGMNEVGGRIATVDVATPVPVAGALAVRAQSYGDTAWDMAAA